MLRDGRNAGTFATARTSRAEVLAAMLGNAVGDLYGVGDAVAPGGETCSSVEGLTAPGRLDRRCRLRRAARRDPRRVRARRLGRRSAGPRALRRAGPAEGRPRCGSPARPIGRATPRDGKSRRHRLRRRRAQAGRHHRRPDGAREHRAAVPASASCTARSCRSGAESAHATPVDRAISASARADPSSHSARCRAATSRRSASPAGWSMASSC